MENVSFDKLPHELARLHDKVDRVEKLLLKTQVPKVTNAPARRSDAAKYLGISLPTLDTLIKTNQLEVFYIGRQVRISWDTLENYVKGNHT